MFFHFPSLASNGLQTVSDEEGRPPTIRRPDQDWLLPLRRPKISFSQGGEWKAAINKYIDAIPLSGDA